VYLFSDFLHKSNERLINNRSFFLLGEMNEIGDAVRRDIPSSLFGGAKVFIGGL
jgi:hypothetical protein